MTKKLKLRKKIQIIVPIMFILVSFGYSNLANAENLLLASKLTHSTNQDADSSISPIVVHANNDSKSNALGQIKISNLISISNDYKKTTNLIYNSKGNTWPASGDNIQNAINDLNGPGEVWIPKGNYDVNKSIYISHSGTKIHGQGSDKTTIVFHNSRLISSKNPSQTNDTKTFSYGLDNIQLDNFKFTGDGNLELILGNNTKIYDVVTENITYHRPGAFRFIIPTKTKHANGLTVTNCQTYKTHSHGFFINALAPYCTIENVTYSNCSARYAGWPFPSSNSWSVGFDLCEYYGSKVNNDMTIKNVLVNDCTAEYNWESGFHFEARPDKINVTLKNCLAQYNGQKKIIAPETVPSYQYLSGFMGMRKEVTLINCVSNFNTHFGYLCSSDNKFPPAVFINCTGTGNWDGLKK